MKIRYWSRDGYESTAYTDDEPIKGIGNGDHYYATDKYLDYPGPFIVFWNERTDRWEQT